MAHIGILVHEHDKFKEGTYFLGYIAEAWRHMGMQVSIYQGIPEAPVTADLVFLHVDLTSVPLDYLAFVRGLPHAVNIKTGDISKSKISHNVLKRSDLFGGRVIIKTDNNCGGYKEANLDAKLTPGGRWRRFLDDKLPWRMSARTLYTYPILKGMSKVPHNVWKNPNFVVEKFRPEKKGDLYCLRTWVFLGDKETHSICYSKEPVVKSDNVIERKELGDVPEELRRRRQELGFEFGKFDYAINKDEVVLYDVNHTPTLGNFPPEKLMPGIQRLADGIFALLPAGKKSPATAPRPAAPTPPPGPRPDSAADTAPVTVPSGGFAKPAIAPDYPAGERLSAEEYGPETVPAEPEGGYWDKIAADWQQVGPPLRPSVEDIKFVTAEVQKLLRPRALILGVTPELCELSWPYETKLHAVDHSQAMINAIWPGPAEAAVCAPWTALPFEDGSMDVIVGDGGFHLLSYPDEQHALVRELHRVLSPEGLVILRLFSPPATQEDTVSIVADLVQGKINNLNQLKLRFGMAMQNNPAEGVALRDFWQKLHREAGPWKNLAALVNWPLAHLEAVDAYKDSPNRYHYVSAEEVKRMFCNHPGGFSHHASHVPVYPLGERCPTVIFRKT